uniref:WLM domain-containing protein n=1 Tax=Chromera velia CCMP2878 TaxID=1169474 RepID=A0A0G4I3N1_9ALVE|eukprot:Cvel_35526.t1-p1 / transcript=Cvel_35526.t1 / gene=Cvel_35526 / organism=Chromera_velia_CCMP2878 / gene_product=Ubiquitin and WLM domain-containing protein, putative / transcript_product=Ubiquitin and WLM domain-containing protein, putative / location=Cvel_scaffold6528:226-2510(-) / protein_length=231 / sequence_SO=supercontig / SO=protein_coding / is_pseudo=false
MDEPERREASESSSGSGGGVTFNVSFRGQDFFFELAGDEPLSSLHEEAAAVFGVWEGSIKLIYRGKLLPKDSAEVRTFGLPATCKVMCVASRETDVKAVGEMRSDPLLRGFDQGLQAQGLGGIGVKGGGEKGPKQHERFRFLSFSSLPMYPDAGRALEYLYELSSDPGIVHLMQKYEWQVGRLDEMPPAGKVGVDPVCVLGYNTNKGQKITLRLRTDDEKGFRKYQTSVRE